MSKKVTMTDIARAVGVSQTLVSFVLSGKNDMGIGADTRKKVLDTARKLGYCSNAASQMLKLGRSGFILLAFCKNPEDDLGAFIHEADKAVSEFGFRPVITSPLKDTKADDCISLFRDGRIDGVIVFGRSASFEKELAKANVAFSVIESVADGAVTANSAKLCEEILFLSANEKSIGARKKSASKGRKSVVAKDNSSAKKEAPEQIPVKKQESIWLL